MKVYNIMWFDDEHSILEIIKEQASLHGINLAGFSNAVDGINELEKKYWIYDAVIIDGLFFNKPGQTGDAKSDKALVEVFRKLDNLADKKIIPSFILSGQKSFTKEENPYAKAYKANKVYDKQSEKDLSDLWRDIKIEADQLEETQIRHQFQEFFNSCNNLEIDAEYQKFIIDILKSIKFNFAIDEMLYFVQFRKIIEQLFRKAEKKGILHSKCIQHGEVNLSESRIFLSGFQTKYLGVSCKKAHFPGIIAENVKNIIFISGAAVHTEDDEIRKAKISVEELQKTNSTPFLIYGLAFQLMDIVIWFNTYINENLDQEKNKLQWQYINTNIQETGWIKGEITKIAENGYGTFQPNSGGKSLSVIPSKVIKFSLCSQQMVEVMTKFDDTGTKTLIENIRLL